MPRASQAALAAASGVAAGARGSRIALRQLNRKKTTMFPTYAHLRHADSAFAGPFATRRATYSQARSSPWFTSRPQAVSKAHISRGHGAFRLFSMAQVRITRELPHTEPPRRRHRLNGTPQTRRCSGCRRERSIFTGMLHSTCTAWLPNPTRPGETLQNTRSSREQVVPRRSKRNIEDRIAQRNAAGGRNLAGRTA